MQSTPSEPNSAGSTAGGALLRRLKQLGIDYVFGNAGTDFPPLIEALAAAAAGGTADQLPEAMVMPHEHAAMGMAHGYYLVTGEHKLFDNEKFTWSLGYYHTLNTDDILNVAAQQTGRGYFLNAGDTLRQGIEAAIDREHLAVDVARRVAAQETHDVRHLRELAVARLWNRVVVAGANGGAMHEPRHLRLDRPRRHGIHAHAGIAELHGMLLGHVDQRGFARAVGDA